MDERDDQLFPIRFDSFHLRISLSHTLSSSYDPYGGTVSRMLIVCVATIAAEHGAIIVVAFYFATLNLSERKNQKKWLSFVRPFIARLRSSICQIFYWRVECAHLPSAPNLLSALIWRVKQLTSGNYYRTTHLIFAILIEFVVAFSFVVAHVPNSRIEISKRLTRRASDDSFRRFKCRFSAFSIWSTWTERGIDKKKQRKQNFARFGFVNWICWKLCLCRCAITTASGSARAREGNFAISIHLFIRIREKGSAMFSVQNLIKILPTKDVRWRVRASVYESWVKSVNGNSRHLVRCCTRTTKFNMLQLTSYKFRVPHWSNWNKWA